MLCAFICSYSTLPMIGTGCGMPTDHLKRSGVIGNGASPKCGMPASLATVETATVGGVVDEPMMMSAFDSVTKRRALVVAAGGSPPASTTVTLSGTPPTFFGTNSSAFLSGMPPAAVVEPDHLERHTANFLRHEFKRVALGNAQCRRRPGRRDGDADDDLIGLRQRRQPRQRQRRRDNRGRQIKLLHSVLPFGVILTVHQNSTDNSAPSLGDASL